MQIDRLRTAIAEGAPSLKPVEVHALAKKLKSDGFIALHSTSSIAHYFDPHTCESEVDEMLSKLPPEVLDKAREIEFATMTKESE